MYNFLNQFESFVAFKSGKVVENGGVYQSAIVNQNEQTPEESIEVASKQLKESLKDELLDKIKKNSPRFFKQLVVDLLVAMGYGGSHQDAAQAIGKTNDGGIDGVISEDRLGLDKIYIQAKRWENTVGRPDIQQFKGALADQVAKKGVFITTSNFSKEAVESAKKSGIVLIDGSKLTSLMIEFGLSVQIERSFHIYKIDQDRFDEDNF
ncbi:restriction endonuclease [Acinetobacter junii]|nr:restriction endonuclease [Acinetobacter junii]